VTFAIAIAIAPLGSICRLGNLLRRLLGSSCPLGSRRLLLQIECEEVAGKYLIVEFL